MRYGLAYGWRSTRRRARQLTLPALTTATGAFLVVVVFAMADGIRTQASALGHAEEVRRAMVLIAVTVLLVGVVEVAVSATRTITQRTRELGVLGATGVRATPVVTALMVEPVVGAGIGAVGGAVLAAVVSVVLDVTGLAASGADPTGTVQGMVLAVVVSVVAAVLTSLVPTIRAVRRPPIVSLSA